MSSNGKPSSFSHSITSHTLLTLSVGVSFQVALPGPPVHSSGGALPRFRRGNSGAKQPLTSNHFFSSLDTERYQRPSSQVAPIALAWTDLTSTRQATEHWRRLWGYSQCAGHGRSPTGADKHQSPSGNWWDECPPKTPNQPRNTGGREMNDGQEVSVTPDREILDLDGDQEGPEIENSGRRAFLGIGDDQSRQMQEMHHWMRSVEDRLARNFSRKRGRSRSRSGTWDSRNPSSKKRHPRRRSRSRERRRSPTPRRRRSPSPRRRRSPTPRRSRTPDYSDDGWEQGIVGRTPFAPHILRVRFPRSFTKPTDMGYDRSTDPEDHLDAFEGRMNCECARDAMRCKAFPVSLAGQAVVTLGFTFGLIESEFRRHLVSKEVKSMEEIQKIALEYMRNEDTKAVNSAKRKNQPNFPPRNSVPKAGKFYHYTPLNASIAEIYQQVSNKGVLPKA
ncbi:hypothetical protein PIB30_058451 [Stylosanthes scabra]|uniref:Uncharacterized protein n=1 Tax=Stylosanthes scabra TaxID=79078 RepID=A0ABU6SKS3_9FABA|nr:hypothetical protein [Stylosanthes scabra]